jgi:hypothetical protein
MGRSYWFECPKCSYRAKVSGRADRGLSFFVQTILCRDCRELYDAVTRLKVPDELDGWGNAGGLRRAGFLKARPRINLQCPVSAIHRVRSWNDPDRCPKCGVYLEKSALPYRLWD